MSENPLEVIKATDPDFFALIENTSQLSLKVIFQ